jgi:protoporphyrinogen/coproporphyrinogen III oxidase
VTGLAAAYRLCKLSRQSNIPLRVLLLEAGDRLGGTIQTIEQDGFLIEAGPDSFITEKPWALNLSRELGLGSELIETNHEMRRSFIAFRKKLIPVPEGLNILGSSRLSSLWSSSILSFWGKARVSLETLVSRREGEVDESIASFVKRRYGYEFYERLAQPMVGAIYGANPEKLSIQATLPRFRDLERAYGSVTRGLAERRKRARLEESGVSGPRYGLFMSFKRGMQTLIDGLEKQIPEDVIQFQSPIKQIEKMSDETPSWRVFLNDGEIIDSEGLCLALPAHASARLLRNVDSNLSDSLQRIPYGSSATLNLGFRRDEVPHALDGFGFVVPESEAEDIIGGSFSSVKYPNRAPQGKVLLRLFFKSTPVDEEGRLQAFKLEARAQVFTRKWLGITASPLLSIASGYSRSMPQYLVGHLDQVREIEERLKTHPGLALAGNSFHGVGIPDCVKSAEEAATLLFREKSDFSEIRMAFSR